MIMQSGWPESAAVQIVCLSKMSQLLLSHGKILERKDYVVMVWPALR